MNGPQLQGDIFSQTFTKGIDQSVPIVADNHTISLSPSSFNLEHMYIRVVDYKDGEAEALSVDGAFSHPSLSVGTTRLESNAPAVLYFQGPASSDVYIQALRSVRYSNLKDRPTVGDRLIAVTIYDGTSTNAISSSSHVILFVTISNIAPVLSVSGTSDSYFNRFFPANGPVAAINPQDAYLIDNDSAAISMASLQLYNVRNAASETLSVTYMSPESVSQPVIIEALGLDLPFGTLWRGEKVPMVTSTILVSEMGSVGDVDVVVDIRHSWIGDLRIEIEHNGRRELLVLSPGGQICNRDDLFLTTFDSDTSSNVFLSKSTSSPGLCTFQSQGLFTPDGDLSSFMGDPMEGEWKLHVTDLLLENDNGRLISWSLVIQPEEVHTFVSQPSVIPPLTVSQQRRNEERHTKEIDSDGRIRDLSVTVHLGVSSIATQLYLPTLHLVHPDGTRVQLADGNVPLCAVGNFSYLVYQDRNEGMDYTCAGLLNRPQSGSGSGLSGSGLTVSRMGSGNENSTDEPTTTTANTASGNELSFASGSGSGSGISSASGMLLTPDFDDVIDLNISIPLKQSLADLLSPSQPLSVLTGKLVQGKWSLVVTSDNDLESTLLGWTLRIAREPNIDSFYNRNTNTLTLTGADSARNYERVLQSIVYNNIAPEPDFSIQRYMETTVYDGEAYSNVSLPFAQSNITIHHIDIDLDPFNTTSATFPDFSVIFREHSEPIPVLDSQGAHLADEFYSTGDYILTITLKGYQNFNEEGLSVNISMAPDLQAVITNNTENQEFVITITSAVAEQQPIESFEAVMRTAKYYNFAEEFINDTRSVEFFCQDRQMNNVFVSFVAISRISLESTNDLPVLVLNSHLFQESDQFSNLVDYVEGLGSIPITNASAIILTDNDHQYLESVTIVIQNPQDGVNEVLNASTDGTSILSEYNISTHALVLSGRDSLDNYSSVLGTVSYENTVHSPGKPGTEPRQITFVPYDGTHEGLPAVALVTFATVNDPAFGDLNGNEEGTGFATMFVEEEGPVRIVSSNASLYDVDNESLAYIEVSILNVQDGRYEVLEVMNIVESSNPDLKVVTLINLRPVTSYDVATATLRISGLDSIREYLEVLKTLTYNNLADEPSPATRNISVVLSDGLSVSDPLYVIVDIQLVNDSPFFDDSIPPFQPVIYEDIPEEFNTGFSILNISYLISDDDVNSTTGIAVVGLESDNGVWEYTTDGENWTAIATSVLHSYALALESSPENAIRFVPNQDFNGIVPLYIVAWDGTDGSVTGMYINAESRSNIDPFSNTTLTIPLTVRPVNDAPVLQEVPLNFTTILEDEQNNTGDSILSLLSYVTDADLPSQFGIAVIDADQENGTWQFTTDGGLMWEEFGIVNESSALLLHSLPVEDNRVRFVPDINFNGQVSISVKAWDLTRLPVEESLDPIPVGSGMQSGSGTSTESGSSSSSDTGSADYSGSFASTFGSGISIPDVNNVTSTEPPPIPPYPSGTRYINTSMSDPVTGPFSVNETTATIIVSPINDSPVITPGMTLHSICENTDISMNHGTMVANIIQFGRYYTDVDVNPDTGLAVVEVDDRNGEWQYTCESPMNNNWMTFIGGMYYDQIIPRLPLPEKATLLLSSCWIRFVPQPFFNTELNRDGYPRRTSDTPFIRALGWDNTGRTAGRSGSYGVNTTYAADSAKNEFSANVERITIQVTSINDPPILYLTNTTHREFHTVYEEDGLPVRAIGEDLTLIDNDHARLRDITVTIYGSIFEQSPFSAVDFGSAFSGDSIFIDDDSQMSSGISGTGSASTSASGSGSGSGTFAPTQSPNPQNVSTYVPVISSAPFYPPLHRVEEYVRNLSSPSYMQRYCAGLENRREELLVDTTNLDLKTEVLSWCPFVIRLFSDPEISPDASVEMFRIALGTLHYNNSLEEPEGGDRTLTFVVSDNVDLSDPVNATVFVENINDSPQLDLNDYIIDINNFVSYTEGQGPLVLANDSALRLIDHDNTTLQGARIMLIEAPDADFEVLNATLEGTNITQFYDNSTYVLYLSGSDTVDAYADVLATVSYTNLYAHPGNPDERERQVYFYVTDGNSESIAAIAYISFTGVNNRPHVDVNGGQPGVNYTAFFIEEQGPVRIVDSDMIIHDEDNRTLAYVTAQILDPIDFGLEFLEVSNVTLTRVLESNSYDHDKVVEITNLIPNMTFDLLTSTLTIRGLDSVDEYMLVLRSIMYNNLADEPVPMCRTVEFVANDWELDSEPVYTRVCIQLENDSPRFNTSVEEVYSPLILEDEFDSVGIPVFVFAHELLEDDDFPPPGRGIAIISAESENGEWEFRTGGSSTWRSISRDINITTALLLRAEAMQEDYIRFVPQENFNGNASIGFVAWDASDDMPSGVTRSAISRTNLDPFSEDARTMVLRIVPVNDAPILDANVEPQMTNILEDDVIERESLGDDVGLFLEALIVDYDVMDISQHEFGIAVVGVNNDNGYWQFSTDSGTNWTNITTPSPQSAVVLGTRPEGWNRIRFVPNPDYNGASSFQYKLWDRNVTLPSGTVRVDTNTDPVNGTFSVQSTTAHVIIEPVNDSPMLLGHTTLDRINEDRITSSNSGTFVRNILRSVFVDIDGNGVGLAVLYVDRRNGEWQYTCELGNSQSVRWRVFRGEQLSFDSIFGPVSQVAPPNPNEFRATLLDSECRIRFLPNTNFNTEYNLDGSRRSVDDTPFISIRAWDETSGFSLQEGVDTTSTPDDHTNAFSLAIMNATIAVLSENDIPVLNLNGVFPNYLAAFTEPVPPERQVIPVPIVNPTSLTITDADNASLASATISFQLYDSTSESLTVNVSGTSLNYTTGIVQDGGVELYLLTITPINGPSSPVGDFETVLRTIYYLNTAQEPNTTNRLVTFTINDGIGFTSPSPVADISINLVNDPPQLDLARNWPDSYLFVSYREGEDAKILLTENTTLVDFDNTILTSATVRILSPPDMNREILNASDAGTNITVISNGYELLLQGPASVEDFLEVILTTSYENTFAEPGDPSTMNRTIQFIVNDGQDNSIPALVYLFFSAINNRPFLDINGPQPGFDFTTVFREEEGPVSIVSPSTVLEDIDNETLAFIDVTITNPRDDGMEVLYVEDVSETSAPLDSKHVTFWNYRPQQYYNSTSYTLRIYGLDSVYEFQEVLKTLKYDNLADEPNSETRVIHFLVHDGHLGRSGVYSNVRIMNINDSPRFNSSAPLFEPVILEDVPDSINPGWSVEELTGSQLILDDDSNSITGIAIVELESENGYWEVTWDYTTNVPFPSSGSASGDLFSGSAQNSSAQEPNPLQPTFSGLEPVSGDGTGSTTDVFGGSSGREVPMTETPSVSASGMMSTIVSGIGSGLLSSGSGILGSGSASGFGTEPTPTAIEPPLPKCAPVTRPTPPPIMPMFYATWQRLPSNTSLAMATVLRADGESTRVRFVPQQNFDGQASFCFVAWDASNGLSDGVITNATSTSNTDPYSSDYVTINVELQPVNDSPLLTNLTFNLTSIEEDDVMSFGDDVGDLLEGVSDIDITDINFGIAVVYADEENGEWQFSTDGGSSWTTMVDVCPYNATVLSSQPYGANRVRFVPYTNFNGNASFSFLAWDFISGESSGTMLVDTTISDPITGAFSTTHSNATIYVGPVNDSPVITQGSHLDSIFEDVPVAQNNGTLVSDIVDGFYFDVDEESLTGIAVVGVDIRFGTWEWRCPESDSWNEFIGDLIYGVIVPPLPLPEKATLLAGNCLMRFLPNKNFNTLKDTDGFLRPLSDLPYIRIRGWDNTGLSEGLSGQYGIDTTYNNDSITNEFSSETETAIVEVISVNDLPEVRITNEGDGLTYSTQYTEEQSYVRIVEPPAVSFQDMDHSLFESLSIVVSNSLDAHSEILSLEVPGNVKSILLDSNTGVAMVTLDDNTTEHVQIIMNIYTGEPDSQPSELTFATPPGMRRARIEAYEALLAYVTYRNLNPEPNNATRVIQFFVNDSEEINSMVVTNVEMLLLNDNSPILTNYLKYLDFTEGEINPVSIVSENLTLTDSDHKEFFFMTNATIELSPIPVSQQENVSVSTTAVPTEYNITQDYNPDSGTLSVTGNAPVSVYEALLRTAVYQNTIEEPLPGIRTVTMQVYDGDNLSNVQRVMVNVIVVNDRQPIVTTSNTPFLFTERSHPVAISNGLTISDADSGNFLIQSIIFTILNSLMESEILNVTDYGSVTSQFQNLTLTLSGPASIADFQRTISALTYTNLEEEPAPDLRNISVQASDGDFNSVVEYIQVAIELVNDIPVILFPIRETIVNYVEGSGPVSIASNISLTDNDHPSLQQFTVIITNPLDMPNEILNVRVDGVNITAVYQPDIGLLSLTGEATLEEYQSTLRTLTYENIEADPGFPETDPRMIEFVAYDGQNTSSPVEILLTFESVNDAPMIDLNGMAEGANFTTSFIEEGGPVLLAEPDAIVFDIDNTSLSYVRIRIENLLDGSNEILSVSANLSEQFDLAVYSFEAGTLLIEGLGETENFQAAVASITYDNTADEPNFATRVISFVASDGLLESIVQYTTVEIIPVNDPPRLIISGGQRTSPPPVIPAPTELPTTSQPSINGSGDGISGSGLPASGSGIVSGQSSGSGSTSGKMMSGSGESLDPSSGMNISGSGMGPVTTQIPTPGPEPTVDPNQIIGNMTFEDDANYTTFYIENSPPVPIIDVNGVLIEDDDNGVMLRLQVLLEGVLDPGYETVFFDTNALSPRLVRELFLADRSNAGYLGDVNTCVSGSGAMKFEEIDIEVTNPSLSILDWEDVLRSLRYCNSDQHPVNGTRMITFRIQDPELAWSENQTTTVQVFAVNDAPFCETTINMFTIDEDTNITIPVLQNCRDHEDILTGSSIFIYSQPSLGEAIVDNTTGVILFLPAMDDYGTRRFSYQACDSFNICSQPQMLTIMIRPINDPPYATDDLTLIIQEDTTVTVSLRELYFRDVEDDLIPNNPYPRVENVFGSTGGSWTLQDNINSTLTYEPFPNFVGQDQLILEVCDSTGTCVLITVSVIVESVNDAPEIRIIYPDGSPPAVTNEDTLLNIEIVVIDVEDRDPVNVTVVSVMNGTAVPNTSNLRYGLEPVTDNLQQTMNISYTPDLHFYGNDVITIAATDSDGGYIEATINVSVLYVNDAPIFGITRLTIVEDDVRMWRLPMDLSVSDPEDVLHAGSFSIIKQASLGSITYTFNETFYETNDMFPPYGVLTYFPPEHYFTSENETITFTLQACDNDTETTPLCTNTTIHLIILSDNDAPHLPPLNLELYEDGVGVLYLWNFTYDVEEGRPPIENVSLIEPLPQRGVASYNTTTGYLTFVPYPNQFGIDYVYYNACDSLNHCSVLRGEIEVNILEVNDPPVALDFLHIAREDDFDLIGFFQNITDLETENLRIEIVNPADRSYMEEWTTPIGGRLRVYHAHQIITYLPPNNYVGPDSFEYAVCDTCDPRRDRELGRIDPDPQCLRQIEENGGDILAEGSSTLYITCANARVDIVVANINDVPIIGNIFGITETGASFVFAPFDASFMTSDLEEQEGTGTYFYRNISSSVFDPDDNQTYLAIRDGLNLTLYNLNSNTDINETSLVVRSGPDNGVVVGSIVDGRSRLTYIPSPGFSGYDQLLYEICDKQRSIDDTPRCSEATARIWVTRLGPEITSIVANGASSSFNNRQDSDSKISVGDTIRLTFAEATNMPPYGDTEQILTSSNVDQIFNFDPPFFLDEITPEPYTGQWLSPTEFVLTIIDSGYPQPFISQTENGIEKMTEVRIGQWRLSLVTNQGPCGGFNADGQRITNIDPYCLLSADETTLHSTSVSPTLQGDFGLKLPEVSNVLVSNTAVDDSILDSDLSDKALFLKSQIGIILKDPLSYGQLALYCEKDASTIIDGRQIAESVDLIVVGCANLLSDGTNADEIYDNNIQIMRNAFSNSGRRRRDASYNNELERDKRQTSTGSVSPPVASEIILQANNLVNPRVDPTTNPQGFVDLIFRSFNNATLASVIQETLGVSIDAIMQHSSNAQPVTDPFYYYEFDNELTPQILRIQASDPDNLDETYGAGDTITIFFDRNTNQPAVVNKASLDLIFMFEPPLGDAYTGNWLSPSVLQITVVDAALGEGVLRPSTNPPLFNLTFTPNYFHTGAPVTSNNTVLPTETPWCIGINVCGSSTTTGSDPQSIGICNDNQISCRAYQGWTNLDGNFGTGVPLPVSVFPWWWIIVAIVIVVLIVVIIVIIYFVYRHYTHKAQRKEALRVVRRWKKDQFAPGKEQERKDVGPKPWVKPPDVTTMRENPDPFETLSKLPEVVPRPPTAMMENENLPPIPRQPFKPREPASIRPSVTSLPPLASGPPRPQRNISVGSLVRYLCLEMY